MEGQPVSVIKAAQEARIRHLEKEIQTFKENIKNFRRVNKMAIQTIKFDDRQVFVGTPSDIMMAEIASPFAVLLTASDSQEQKKR
ncbi:hypothetical protein AB3538_07050 [Acinetobacter baumannii]